MDEKDREIHPLPEAAFGRYDETPDEKFYVTPRLVTHLDDRAIAAVTQLYRENEAELQRNERLDSYVVQNLNANPRLPFGDTEFDGCGICVSIDYLTRPVEVLQEVGRVLKGGAPVVITFSNRCFPTKAVAVWHQLDDQGHVRLVERYLHEAGNWSNVQSLDRSPRRLFSDPLYAVIGQSAGPTGHI